MVSVLQAGFKLGCKLEGFWVVGPHKNKMRIRQSRISGSPSVGPLDPKHGIPYVSVLSEAPV